MVSSTSVRTSWAFRLGNDQRINIGLTVRHTFYGNITVIKPTITFEIETWAPADIGKRGTCPHRKCCSMFVCINSYSKMLSRRIIYPLLSQPVVGFWGFTSRLPPGFHPWTPLGEFRSRPLICQPLKKILRMPMNRNSPCVVIFLPSQHR